MIILVTIEGIFVCMTWINAMIVTFPGVVESFFIESNNLIANKATDGRTSSYKIEGDDFIQLVNSPNIVYIFVAGTLGLHDPADWESFVELNIFHHITRTTVFHTKFLPNNCSVSRAMFTLYGFVCESDATLFKLTWL
jgi:hypothetical protein